MKRKIITAIAIVASTVGFSALNASAWGWGHGNSMMGPNMRYGSAYNGAPSQEFLDETKSIRVQLEADRAELNALMASQNPDSKRVRELSESIATSRIALQEKSQAYGMNNGRYNGRHMRGPGMMYGGYGPCGW